MKKLLSVVLVITMILTLLPAGVVMSSALTSGDYTYTVTDSKATISAYSGSGGNVTIPSDLDGYPVTEIGSRAFYDNDTIVRIVIPDSVTVIGDQAFYDCDGLTSVIIGNGVTTIGIHAFTHCNLLEDVTIGNHLSIISDNAFYGNIKLKNIVFPNSLTRIGTNAFGYCYALTQVNIPNSVVSIGDVAFYGCREIVGVKLGSGITAIGLRAFNSCSKLTAAYFYGNAPTSIESTVFGNCAAGFTLYHLSDKTGFNASWNVYPTAVFMLTGQYTITFDAAGGTGGTSSLMNSGSALVAPVVSKPGYTLTGWSPSIPSTVPAENTVYTAQWSVNSYTITFSGNGGTGSASPVTQDYNTNVTLPTTGFAKIGYTFLGWNTTPNASTVLSSYSIPAGNATLYAIYGSVQDTITFNSNGGSAVTAITQDINTTVSKPVDPTKTGYTFKGWYSDSNFTNAVTWPYTLASNVTFYAKWTRNTYTVTYDAQGGTVSPLTRVIGYGYSYDPLPTPTKADFVFMGWYTEPNGSGTKILACDSVTIAQDHTLYAYWIPETTCTVTFDAMGGSVSPATKTVTVGLTYGDLPVPIKAGYSFCGWYFSPPSRWSSDLVFSFSKVTNQTDHTLYARWGLPNYTLTLALNDGSGGIFDSYSLPQGTKVYFDYFPISDPPILTPTDPNKHYIKIEYPPDAEPVFGPCATYEYSPPVRPGYDFVCWSESMVDMWNSDVTVYAIWSKQEPSYTSVTFDATGGNGGISDFLKVGDPLTPPTVTKAGYTFDGWEPTVPTTVPDTDTTYYAKWHANTYSVDYDGNGNTGGSTSISLHEYDYTSVLTQNGFIKTGYTFAGWSTSPNGPVVYTDSQTVKNLSAENNAVVTLYAQWTINQYTMSFNSNGGSSVSPVTQSYNSSVAEPTDPSKSGYTFGGWYSDAGLTSAVAWPYTITGDITLYAKWISSTVADYSAVNAALALANADNLPVNATHDPDYMVGGRFYNDYQLTNNGYYARSMFTASSLAAVAVTINWNLTTDDQATVDGYAETIMAAYNNLELAPADYSALTSEMNYANRLPRDGIMPNSLAQLDEAMAAASGVVKASYKLPLQNVVDDAVYNLQIAINKLVYKTSEYIEVEDILREIPDNDGGLVAVNYDYLYSACVDYTVDNLKVAVDDAYTWARGGSLIQIYPKPDYIGNLMNAIRGLIFRGADYTIVDCSLENIPDGDGGDIAVDTSYLYKFYTKSEVDTLLVAVDNIDRALNAAEQSTVDSYAEAINEAVCFLTLLNADYTNLVNALAKSPIWSGSYYTEESYSAYINAVAAGNELYNECLPKLQQQEIDDATSQINSAYTALTLKAVTYTVKYQSADGTTLLTQIMKNATAADLITETAPAIAGYTPAQASIQQRMTGTDSENVMTFTYNKDKADDVCFTVNNTEGYNGDTVTVAVVISENSNMSGATFELPYNPDLFEYVSAVKGSALANGFVSINVDEVNHKITATYISTEPLTAGGSILEVQFKIKAGVSKQTVDTNFSIVNLVNIDCNELPFMVTQGSIGIKNLTGDVNSDGVINVVDALMILHHVSGYRSLNGDQLAAADVDKNGVINIIDALKILQYSSGMITSF